MAKPKKKFYEKKLSDAGTGSVLLCVFAFVFALCSLLLEPVGYLVHSSNFDKDVGLFSGSPWYNYAIAYDKHIIIFVLSFAAMLICGKNRSRKKLGAELGIVMTFSSAALVAISSTALLSAYDNGLLSKTYAVINNSGLSQDFKDFDRFMAMLYYLLPLLSSSLLLIAGIMIWGRCGTEDFKVKCPVVTRVVESLTEEADKPAETAPTFEYSQPEIIDDRQKPREYDHASEIAPGAELLQQPVPEPASEPMFEPIPEPIEDEIVPEPEPVVEEPTPEPEPVVEEPTPEPEPEPVVEEPTPEPEPEPVVEEPKPEQDLEPALEPQPEKKPELLFCPECGSKLREGSKFCSSCGTKLF
ncbi:MAG: zinc-ribbon domain-containing protein [Ruminococcus sp.]|nr:zinc-ribbon domain-containing protein [Ruminococcus sp.]